MTTQRPKLGPQLSRAEAEVADLLCRGMRLKEIADARGTTVKTTKAQVTNARTKLGAKTLAHLAAMRATENATDSWAMVRAVTGERGEPAPV